MTEPIRVEELGQNGRLVPSPRQLDAVLAAVQSTLSADAAKPTRKSTASLWRFSGRGWGNHPADRRSRPQRRSAY
jgi:hypothetical protein